MLAFLNYLTLTRSGHRLFVGVVYSLDNQTFTGQQSQFRGVESNRGGFYESWATVIRDWNTQKPLQSVVYAENVFDANSGQTLWDNNNGQNYQLTLPPVKKLVKGVESFNPINAFVLSRIGQAPYTYYLAGQVFSRVTPVAPGHAVCM